MVVFVRVTVLSVLFAFLPVVRADDAVIFPDGFYLRGRVEKEGIPPQLDKVFTASTTFTYLSSGPRFVIFTPHVSKGAKVTKDLPPEKLLDLRRPPPVQLAKLPASGNLTVSDFNADGRRTLDIKYDRFPPEQIIQVATIMTPKLIRLDAIKFRWREVLDPKDLGYPALRKILTSHPEIKDGWLPVVDPLKRMTLARFFKEMGWHDKAKLELKQLKLDAPWAWSKEAGDKYDELLAQVEEAETAWVLGEVELALNGGQYQAASQFLNGFQPKNANARDITRLADLKAKVQDVQPKYQAIKAALKEIIDIESGERDREQHMGLVGSAFAPNLPLRTLTPTMDGLLRGAKALLNELHPDTIDRVNNFREIAGQKETPNERKLATAVSGWLLGKNGSKPDPEYAYRLWLGREMVSDYLRLSIANDRAGVLKTYRAGKEALSTDELAQIITNLPPIDPQDATTIKGTKVNPRDSGATDTFKIETGPVPEDDGGLTYYVRLPREYHVGRSYPVVLALHTPEMNPEQMIGQLAVECERNGYILAAPAWGTGRVKSYDMLGKEHRFATSCLRDLSRRFQIDPDKVFAFGFASGGNFALDLAMSKPHLFAGVVSMAADFNAAFYREYWRNAQRCPVYAVTGETAFSSVENHRQLFSRWMDLGFYAILSIHKGQGLKWYGSELPMIFDWMNRKTRVRGLGSLRLDNKRYEPWQSFRETDDRFYWVGATELSRRNKLGDGEKPNPNLIPATFNADIRNNTVIVNGVSGVRQITVWLEKDMIDWTQKVSVSVDTTLQGMKPAVMTPDPRILLEELYRTGDRKMLFFGKLDFKTGG